MALPDMAPYSHLYNLSGSGKTRLSLDGLCHHWGYYLTCRDSDLSQDCTGSLDFNFATKTVLPSISSWNKEGGRCLYDNAEAMRRVLLMVFCVRTFVLAQLVRLIPRSTNPIVARRRWVLLQAMPPYVDLTDDVFIEILRSIRGGDAEDMLSYIRGTLRAIRSERNDLFPCQEMFLVFDEAQIATYHHIDCFPAFSDTYSTQSVLHSAYRSFTEWNMFHGIILSGTGLSRDIINCTLKSFGAKHRGAIYRSKIYADTGDFLDAASQGSYIRPYLNLSENLSDKYLLQRILRWFKGRWVCCFAYLLPLTRNIVVTASQPASSRSCYSSKMPHVIVPLLPS
jgi:hypothetical protein